MNIKPTAQLTIITAKHGNGSSFKLRQLYTQILDEGVCRVAHGQASQILPEYDGVMIHNTPAPAFSTQSDLS